MHTEATPRAYGIVVGLDASLLSYRALEEALEIAARRPSVELHVVTVAESQGRSLRLPGSSLAVVEEDARQTVKNRVAEVVRTYQSTHGDASLEPIAVYVAPGDPAKVITDLARAVDASLIVVATHGRRGVSRLVMGSVAADVLRKAPCGVYVVRPADFVGGEKVPSVEPPLEPGEPHLKHFHHRRTYHYVDKVAPASTRTMPAS